MWRSGFCMNVGPLQSNQFLTRTMQWRSRQSPFWFQPNVFWSHLWYSPQTLDRRCVPAAGRGAEVESEQVSACPSPFVAAWCVRCAQTLRRRTSLEAFKADVCILCLCGGGRGWGRAGEAASLGLDKRDWAALHSLLYVCIYTLMCIRLLTVCNPNSV